MTNQATDHPAAAAETVLVGRTFRMRCTDQTGHTDTHDVTVDKVTRSGDVLYAHFDRPRGDKGKPAERGERMNTYVTALALAKEVIR